MPPAKPARFQWTLRPGDQIVTAVVVAVALLVLVGHWLYQGRFRGDLIEVERAEPTQIAFQVDINAAPWQELTLLPDIGEQLARRIVEDRDAEGPFGDLNDLRRVRGIGPKTFDRIKPYLVPIPDRASVAGGDDVEAKETKS